MSVDGGLWWFSLWRKDARCEGAPASLVERHCLFTNNNVTNHSYVLEVADYVIHHGLASTKVCRGSMEGGIPTTDSQIRHVWSNKC